MGETISIGYGELKSTGKPEITSRDKNISRQKKCSFLLGFELWQEGIVTQINSWNLAMLCNLKGSESPGLFKCSNFLCLIACGRPSKYFNSYSMKLWSSSPYMISYCYPYVCYFDGNAVCNNLCSYLRLNVNSDNPPICKQWRLLIQTAAAAATSVVRTILCWFLVFFIAQVLPQWAWALSADFWL